MDPLAVDERPAELQGLMSGLGPLTARVQANVETTVRNSSHHSDYQMSRFCQAIRLA